MAPRPRKLSRRQKLIAFAPALIVGCMTIYVASGASVVSGATASTVNISGSVNGSVATDATLSGCADTALDTFEAGYDVTSGCTVTFAANYGAGAEVQFEDNNNGNAAFFCSDGVVGAGGTRSCATAEDRVENVAANSAITNDTLGIALTGMTGAGNDTGTRGSAFIDAADVDSSPTAAEAIWYPITDADQELCFTTLASSTSTTCTFVVGADGDAATASGDYTGQIDLTTMSH
jgi:hypothetical protein